MPTATYTEKLTVPEHRGEIAFVISGVVCVVASGGACTVAVAVKATITFQENVSEHGWGASETWWDLAIDVTVGATIVGKPLAAGELATAKVVAAFRSTGVNVGIAEGAETAAIMFLFRPWVDSGTGG